MLYYAYKQGEKLYCEDFQSEDNLIFSNKDLLVKIKDENGVKFKLKEGYSNNEFIKINTKKELGSNEEIVITIFLNYYWDEIKFEINGLIIQYNHGFPNTKKIEFINANSLKLMDSYSANFSNNSIINISIRRFKNTYYVYCDIVLIYIFEQSEFKSFNNPTYIKWFVKSNETQIIKYCHYKLKSENKIYWLNDGLIRPFPTSLTFGDEPDEDSTYYHLKGEGDNVKFEIREIFRTIDENVKIYWDAFFEITIYGDIYFCMQRRRIAFFSFDIIAQISNCEGRICDNPILIEKLKEENKTITQYVIAVIELISCNCFQIIIKDVLRIKYNIDKKTNEIVNVKIQELKKFNFTELAVINNDFDELVETKDELLLIISKDGLNHKISFQFEDTKLNSFETIISFDLTKSKTLKFFYRDLIINLSLYSDKSSFISTDGDDLIPNFKYFNVINIEYSSGIKKGLIVSKNLPFLHENRYSFKVQNVELFESNLMLFYLNNYFLGSYEKLDFFDFSQCNIIKFESTDSYPFIKLDKLIINEIVSHDLKLLDQKAMDFKSERLYYVSIYRDYDANSNGVYKDQTQIKRITYYEEAEEEIRSHFILQPEKNKEFNYYHYLLTNDYRLINKYRNAVEINELKEDSIIDNEKWHYISMILHNLCFQCKEYSSGGGAIEPYYEGKDYSNSYGYIDGWIISNSDKPL